MKKLNKPEIHFIPIMNSKINFCKPFYPLKISWILLFYFLSFSWNLDAQVHSRPDIYSFSAAERCELRNLMVTFINIGGGSIAIEHQNPPGPLTFQDIHCYNEFFMSWHREYIRRMEEWLLTQNGGSKYVPLPEWDPTTSVPCEFFNNTCTTCPGSAIATGFGMLNNQNPSGYNFSRFLNTNTLCNYTSGFRTPPQFSGKPSRMGTAADNLGWDLEIEHNSPHVSIGGVMGGGTSPAAAIFWLWHGYVDDIYRSYQCECQSDTPRDLYIADSHQDIGNEPNTMSTSYYRSPEIWVRNTQDMIGSDGRYMQEDNPSRHQNPEAGQTNYIYVRIRNIGCEQTSATDVNLRVYFSKASTGLSWPTNWVNYMIGSVTYGDEITTTPLAIPSLDPGEQYVAEIPWFPPDPSSFGETQSHICLLGRLESTVDPMAFTETNSVSANTRNNNNIAWKNVTVVNIDPFRLIDPRLNEFVFEVIQPENNFDPIKLVFNKLGNFNLENTILKANPAIMDSFLLQGRPNNMELIDDPRTGELAFAIKGDSASIENLFLSPGQTLPLTLRFDLTCSEEGGLPCANYGDVFRYDVRQFTQGAFGEGFIGAINYELRIQQNPESICEPIISDGIVEAPICENSSSGFIALKLNGQAPYRIYWSNGANEEEIRELLPGTYQATVVDAANCVDTMSFHLKDNSDLTIDFETESPFCATPNGLIKSSVIGGIPPYKYEWSNGSQDTFIDNLGFGTYTLVVTDAEGCQRTKSVTLGMTMLLGGFTRSIPASSSSAADGGVKAIPTGGVPPYTFEWSNGENSDTLSNLTPGDYIVLITDAKGCTFVDTATIDFTNSIEEIDSNHGVDIFPNPAKEEIQIVLNKWKPSFLDIRITDITGKVLLSKEKLIQRDDFKIDIRDLPQGILYMILNDGKTAISYKFFKTK